MNPGDVLASRFVLRRKAGAGGMGVVWQAEDRVEGGLVALKIIAVDDSELVDRFTREGQLLAGLHHPGIVRYVAHGESADGRWLAMEWLDGLDLAQYLRSGPLDPPEAVVLGEKVANALGAAHRAGVVHRDVKPSNLFLRAGRIDGVRLLDFGIARVRSMALAMTHAGRPIGTPSYMSPEQAKGLDEVDARSDVFSLGVVLHQALAGKKPFAASDPIAVIAKIVLDEPPRLRDLRPDVPADLDELVHRMLAKDPDRRPADGEAVAAEIAAIRTAPSRSTPRLPEVVGLGAREQRLVAVVLAAGAADRAVGLRQRYSALGARVEPMADGSLVAIVTGGAATDLAARGARMALDLGVPAVLATGRAEVGAGLPVGEAIDRAVRLFRGGREITDETVIVPLAASEPGVRVDTVSAALLRGGFVIDGERLVAEVDAPRRDNPLVARDGELMMLESAFAAAVDGPEARMCIVSGPAGIGKSRLVNHWADGVSAEVWRCRGDLLAPGSAWALLADLVRRVAGLRGDLAERRAQLVARFGPGAPFLGEICGTSFDDHDDPELRAARADPRLLGDRLRQAFTNTLARQLDAPVIVLIEDLHWGDAPSLGAFEHAIGLLADRPLLLVATAREEARELFPEVFRGAQTVALAGLPRRAAERLVRSFLGEAAAPADVAAIVEKGGGNALLLEELARAGGAAGEASVVTIVQARLERMEPEARRVLRAASVFGERFPVAGVAALVGDTDLDAWIGALCSRDVLTRAAGADPAFRHALVREAAYAMWTADERAVAHDVAASWLSTRSDCDAATLAEHQYRGARPAHAIKSFLRAAEQSLAGHDLHTASASAERAKACGAAGADRGHAELIRAESLAWRGELPAAHDAAEEAIRWCDPGSDHWFAAIGEAAGAAGPIGDVEALRALSERIGPISSPAASLAAARLAEALLICGEKARADVLLDALQERAPELDRVAPGVAGRAWSALALRARYEGDAGANLRRVRRAIAAFAVAGDLRNRCVRNERLGYALLELGANELAERELREALAIAAGFGLANVAATARHNLGLVLSRLGRHAESVQIETEAISAFDRAGNRRMKGASYEYLALAQLAAGDAAAAEAAARTSIDVATDPEPLPLNLAEARAILAEVLLARGRPEEALVEAQRAWIGLQALGGIDDGEALIRLALGNALLACGKAHEADAVMTVARERLQRRAEKISDPALRATFLESVPENHATVRWTQHGPPGAPSE